MRNDSQGQFLILKKLGISGRILDDTAFSQKRKDRPSSPIEDANLPVQLPGFVIERLPDEDKLNQSVLDEILASKKLAWNFLLEPEVRKSIRELVRSGNLIIVSQSICDDKAIAFGKGHNVLQAWQNGFSYELQGAILISSCLTPHGFLHEAFHLRQYLGKNVPIGLQDIAYKIASSLNITDQKSIGLVVYPFIEAQASYYAIKKMRELYPKGRSRTVPFFNLGEQLALGYFVQNFYWMHGRIRVITGEAQGPKYRATQKIYSDFFFLGKENYWTSPLGFNRFYCRDSERSLWLRPDDSEEELKIEIPQGDWEKVPEVKMEECTSETKAIY